MQKIFIVLIVVLIGFQSNTSHADDEADINHVLDSLHEGAAKADWKNYFSLFSEDAVFLGTDATERWPIDVFEEYAGGRPTGWQYKMTERNINFTPSGNVAWFDELLWTDSYGQTRGTGVLIKTDKGWKISQYHLTIPIPNDLADELSTSIKNYLDSNK